MIYDPRRAVIDLRRSIFEAMTPEEQRAFLTSVAASTDFPICEQPAERLPGERSSLK